MKPRQIVPIIALLIIEILGLVTIWSTAPELFASQLAFVAIGWILIIFLNFLDPRFLFSLSPFWYGLTIFLLVLTRFVGENIRGSVRWINLGFFGLQTSEIAKPLLALFFVWFITTHKPKKWLDIGKYILLSIIPIFIIANQPDLGSALTIAFTAIALIALTGNFKKIMIASLIFLAVFVPLESKLLKPYQRQRIATFINPYADPQGAGYNVIQATIAIGSGGVFGKGVRLGTQSHLNFLPERHTDFIFASYTEEFGLVGAIILLGSYFALLSFFINLSKSLKHKEFSLLSVAIFLFIFFQVIVNTGMNLGIMPVTGITLPFFSYGGSSVLSFSILFGLGLKLLDLVTPFDL